MKTVHVQSEIGKRMAISPEEGQTIFALLDSAVKDRSEITVDFSNLDTITTAFLNSSLGDLYEKWNRDTLNKYIHINASTLTPLQLAKASNVMENARYKLSEHDVKNTLNEE